MVLKYLEQIICSKQVLKEIWLKFGTWTWLRDRCCWPSPWCGCQPGWRRPRPPGWCQPRPPGWCRPPSSFLLQCFLLELSFLYFFFSFSSCDEDEDNFFCFTLLPDFFSVIVVEMRMRAIFCLFSLLPLIFDKKSHSQHHICCQGKNDPKPCFLQVFKMYFQKKSVERGKRVFCKTNTE